MPEGGSSGFCAQLDPAERGGAGGVGPGSDVSGQGGAVLRGRRRPRGGDRGRASEGVRFGRGWPGKWCSTCSGRTRCWGSCRPATGGDCRLPQPPDRDVGDGHRLTNVEALGLQIRGGVHTGELRQTATSAASPSTTLPASPPSPPTARSGPRPPSPAWSTAQPTYSSHEASTTSRASTANGGSSRSQNDPPCDL